MALLANDVNTGFPSSSSRFTSWSGAPSAGRGLINKSTGVHREASESPTSHYPPQVWNFPRNLPQSFQNNFNINGGGRNVQMPFLSSAGQQKHPSVSGFGDVDVQCQTFASKGSSMNQQNQPHNAGLRPPFLMCQEVQQNLVPPASISTPSHLVLPFLSNGYGPQGHGCTFANTVPLNPIPGMPSSQPIPSTSMHLPGAAQPPLPPGPCPALIPTYKNPDLLAGGALSGLLTSLMARGVISLTNQAPVQDLVGLEFSSEFLKVRHESVINALYADLPRQCKSCGARFKSQEDHRRHMDWHVEKNRKSKDRKRMEPSRNWLTSVDVWLHGMEEAVNNAFLSPSVNVVEEKDYDKIVVPADEDQKVCALCGELFVYFFSDETEEWMYKDAVYKNAPPSFGCMTAEMDRSKLGPIVHAKCRGESSVVTSDDFCKNETGCTEEDRQRKRTRIAY